METVSLAASTRTFNRWYVVIGALLIQMSLGAVYIYSVFKPALKQRFPHWSETDLAIPSQVVLAGFAFSMPFFGKLQDRFGPRLVATLGGLLLGIGLVSASFASSLWHFVVSYAVLGGIGIGAAYVCPVATCVKWFPDMRGLITGLAVAGFGAGALAFTPVAKALIASQGVMPTFMYLGLIFFGAVVLGARVMVNPPHGYCPPGYVPETNKVTGTVSTQTEFTWKEMLQTPTFWMLWITYFAGCTTGLMVIMNTTNIWVSTALLSAYNDTPVSHTVYASIVAQGAMAVIVVSVLNAAGRVVWGKVSDLIGRRRTLMGLFLYAGTIMLLLNYLRSYEAYLFGVASIGFCFGGFLALYPAVTADFFGTRHVGANYGVMFSAFGAGGLLGPWLAPRLMQVVEKVPYLPSDGAAVTLYEAGSYAPAFIISGAMCLLSAVLISRVRGWQR
jgi:OFA family oxalate/formate antiporter-like MFS transporter